MYRELPSIRIFIQLPIEFMVGWIREFLVDFPNLRDSDIFGIVVDVFDRVNVSPQGTLIERKIHIFAPKEM